MPKIVIVGAGYAGMISAVALWKQGHDVTLIGPEPSIFGRTFSLLHGTILALETILETELTEQIHTLQTLKLFHKNRWGTLKIHAIDYELPFLLGAIPEKLLHHLLNENLSQDKIKWVKQSLSSLDLTNNTLTTDDDQTIDFDYIIACDGSQSVTRSQAHCQARSINPFTQTSMQLLNTEKPILHAEQIFSQSAIFAQVPLGEDQSAIYITTYDPSPHHYSERNELFSLIPDIEQYGPSPKSPIFNFKSANHLYPSAHKNLILMGEAALSQGPVGAQGINGLVCDLGILLAHNKDLLSSQTKLDSIRQMRYRMNQLTQYSSLMHLGILVQGFIPPSRELFLSQLIYGGSKTALSSGTHEWTR